MVNTKSAKEIKAIHDLHNTDIAKQIRKDLKEAFGKHFKFSVTAPNNSIEINIMEWNIEFFTKEYIEALKKAKEDNNNEDWQKVRDIQEDNKMNTEKWNSIFNEVEKIRNLYNHDKSDLMSDYFDVNYYGGVRIGKWDKDYILK